ncbi:MAG: tetratricopeptide repeat protein [Chloroflexi bacterium]|nr:tetratricopeptide repeat protein [Chloroflexota bacterium]
MHKELVGKKPTFRPARPRNNIYRIMLLMGLILAGAWLLVGVERGQVKPLFLPTPTPTRIAGSYIQEAQAYFQAGKLDDPDPPPPAPPNPDAIDTYQKALEADPNNAQAWAELARIQTYSITMLSSDAQRRERLQEALDSINTAARLNPDDSTIHAIRAFVLDWNASYASAEEAEALLKEAEGEAVRAYQLDPQNALALTFYAEVLLDQQKWLQAEQYAAQAVNLDRNLMDVHRVYATVLESMAQYRLAIEEYLEAARINPNLTFLYAYIGRNYLHLTRGDPTSPLYERALEYFTIAVDINKQLGVSNPIPYLEIAKAYTQRGDFFIAARNAERALSFDPTNPNTYGQLGIIYVKSRNYEGAMNALRCAVRGCASDENETAKQLVAEGMLESSPSVAGLPLTNLTVAYYYTEYGTVLAFLSRPNQNNCPEAVTVLEEVRAAFPEDAVLMEIVADSEGICRRLGSPAAPPVSQPTYTP